MYIQNPRTFTASNKKNTKHVTIYLSAIVKYVFCGSIFESDDLYAATVNTLKVMPPIRSSAALKRKKNGAIDTNPITKIGVQTVMTTPVESR